jgi:hypothetical protein
MGKELQQLYAEGKFAEILVQTEACLPKDLQWLIKQILNIRIVVVWFEE